MSIKPNEKRLLGRVHVLWPFASCKSHYTVGQEGETSSDFFHSKLAGFGPGNCYLTLRAADILNTYEHVLLKDYATGYIAFISASQLKKKDNFARHTRQQKRNVLLYFILLLYFIPLSAERKKSVYRYIGRRLVAEVSSACSNYSRNEVQVTI